MRLSEILKPRNIKVPLTAVAKTDAIAELVNLLAANGDVKDPKKVLEAVLDRETTRTTGIGNGTAIPHGKSNGAQELVVAMGRPLHPIDFQSIDGKPVSIIWLLSSPQDKTILHIQALACISRLMTIEKFRAALLNVKTGDEVFEIVRQQEAQL